MLLNSEEIKARKIIKDEIDKNYTGVSYDLSVHRIINTLGEDVETFDLEPQGIVLVISRERVTLPKDIVGYALIKTRLCNRGILALNTGVIDPEYDGLISTMLLNFSKNNFLVSKGNQFLRLTFHHCNPSSKSYKPPAQSDEKYILSKKERLLLFDKTFLNLNASLRKETDRIFVRYAAYGVAVSAIVLALYPFILTFSLERTLNYSNRSDQATQELLQVINELKDINDAQKSLFESRIGVLEERIEQLESIEGDLFIDEEE